MSRRLVDLIENHADELTSRLVAQIRTHRMTVGLRRFDDLELGRRARELYRHLGYWLRSESDGKVEEAFVAFGRAERALGVRLSDLIGALLLTRRNLWDFVDRQTGDSVLELRQEFDLELLVVRFFDRAILYAARGYESEAGGAGAPTAATGRATARI